MEYCDGGDLDQEIEKKKEELKTRPEQNVYYKENQILYMFT